VSATKWLTHEQIRLCPTLPSRVRFCYRGVVKGGVLLALCLAGCSLSLEDQPKGDGGTGGSHAGGSGGSVASGGAWADGGGTGGATGGADAASDGGGSGGSAGGGGVAASAGSDAGSDAADGSAGASPGSVDCDTVSCDPTSEVCCYTEGGINKCEPPNTCSTGIACDSSEDCGKGLLCCLDLQNVQIQCLATCPAAGGGGNAQFCKLDSECPAGTTCQPVTGLITQYVPASYRSCQ
jgi:hypothetical protein